MRGSIENQVQQIWKHLDGIGKSKYISRKDSEYKSQNNQNISGLVHSYRYKEEVIRTAIELGKFAKEKFDIDDMQQINNEVIASYFASKVDEECSYRSISTYISQVEKVLLALTKMETKIEKHQELFTRESLIEARAHAKANAVKKNNKNIGQAKKNSGRKNNENRAYKNPAQILSLLQGKYFIVANLQLYYGLRVVEASRIKPSQLDEKNLTLSFKGKGGYEQKKVLSKKLFTDLKSLVTEAVANGKIGFLISYNDYTNVLKKAVLTCDEEWNSSHGLRYNYAQDRYDFYIDKGETIDEALRLTSEDLGHHRKEITGRYL